MTDFHDYIDSLLRGELIESHIRYAADRESFTFPTARPQWAPPRHYKIELLIIDFTVDIKNAQVDAISKLKIKSTIKELSKVFLHAAELNITGVRDIDGNELEYDTRPDDESMTVFLEKKLKEGEIGLHLSNNLKISLKSQISIIVNPCGLLLSLKKI